LAPSILSADFNRLGEQIQILQDNHIEVLHIDVMDGAFVPSISFGMPVISSIRKESRLFFDVHLMVQEPARYFEEFVRCGADSITFHVEACQDPEATLTKLKGYPVKTAVSIKPGTEIAAIEPYLPQVDMVLVMGVEPGFGGQALIPSTLDKLSNSMPCVGREDFPICWRLTAASIFPIFHR
jgi:ribulose-phosphate 3-epimerase